MATCPQPCFPSQGTFQDTTQKCLLDPDPRLVCQETFPTGVWRGSIQAYSWLTESSMVLPISASLGSCFPITAVFPQHRMSPETFRNWLLLQEKRICVPQSLTPLSLQCEAAGLRKDPGNRERNQADKLSPLEKSSSGSTVHREGVIGTPRPREPERTLNLPITKDPEVTGLYCLDTEGT